MGLLAFGNLAVTDGWITGMNAQAVMGTLVGFLVTASFLSGAIVTPIVGLIADQFSFDLSFRILAIANLFALPMLRFIKDP